MSPAELAQYFGPSVLGEVRRVEIPAVFVVDIAPSTDHWKLRDQFPAYLAEVASVVLEGGDLLAAGLPFAVVEVKAAKQ